MSILRNLLGGTFWTGVGRYLHYAAQIAVTAVLARLLDPSDFGILSMVVVYTGFVTVLAEAGLGWAVVQKRDLDDAALSTVFWFAVLVSAALVGFSLAVAPLIERFYEFDGLAVVVRVLSINLLLVGLCSVPEGRLRKQLKFKPLAAIDILSALLSGAAAILLALRGIGYWALVGQQIGYLALRFGLLLLFGRWAPRLRLRWRVVRKVVGFSGYMAGFSAINYWARNADNLMVGKFLGAVQLGFYNQAYKLMMVPLQLISGVVNPALFPVFSAVQDDKPQMAAAYLKLLRLIALLSFSVGVYFYLTAEEIIVALWGDKWQAAIPVFEVLALLSAIQPLASTTGGVFAATGQARRLFWLGVVNSAIMISGMVAGLPYGIVGVAAGYALAYTALSFPLTMWLALRTIDARPIGFLAALGVPGLAAAVLFGVLFVARLVAPDLGVIFRLVVNTVLAGVVFVTTVLLTYGARGVIDLLARKEAPPVS